MVDPKLPPIDKNLFNIPDPSDAPSATPFAVLATGPVVKHQFQSLKDPGDDSELVQPGNWNEAHVMTLKSGSIVGRDTTGDGPAQSFPLDTEPSDPLNMPTTAHVQKLINDAVAAAVTGLGFAATGDIMASFINDDGLGSPSKRAGWIKMLGQTIGRPGSGAAYAQNDVRDLYILMWGLRGTDSAAWPVFPMPRGTSAVADWNANKLITLPDARGRVLGALDDGLGVLNGLNLPASLVGEQTHELNQGEMPAHQHGVVPAGRYWTEHAPGGNAGAVGGADAGWTGLATGVTGGDGQFPPSGKGFPHNNVQPTFGVYYWIKL